MKCFSNPTYTLIVLWLVGMAFSSCSTLQPQSTAHQTSRTPQGILPSFSSMKCILDTLPVLKRERLKEFLAQKLSPRSSINGLIRTNSRTEGPVKISQVRFSERALRDHNSSAVFIQTLEEISTREQAFRVYLLEPKRKSELAVFDYFPVQKRNLTSKDATPGYDFFVTESDLKSPSKLKAILKSLADCGQT